MTRIEAYDEFVKLIHELEPKKTVEHDTIIGAGGLDLDSLDVATVLIALELKVGMEFGDESVSGIQESSIDQVIDKLFERNAY